MTSVITSMGALNRFKFCTYVARQQHNRSQSPRHRRRRRQPPPPPPTPPLSGSLLGLLCCYHWKWLINFYKKSINGADYELLRVKKRISAKQKYTPAHRRVSEIKVAFLCLKHTRIVLNQKKKKKKVWTPLAVIIHNTNMGAWWCCKSVELVFLWMHSFSEINRFWTQWN